MHFTKMHGIGNDFIVVNCLDDPSEVLTRQAQSRAIALCDRKFGVGGDGVILVLPGRDVPFRMRMFNPDGSEAEMCGNGIRCFAKYVYDRGLSAGKGNLSVETGAGLLHLQCRIGPDAKVTAVRVDMGPPRLRPEEIPTTLGTGEGPIVACPLMVEGRTLEVTTVSMGNPHAVIFVDDVQAYPVASVGPHVENHSAFPKRTNTEFVHVLNDHEMDFRVWERGAGETLACGTGACAAAVAGALNGKTGREVRVHLPGGDLDIEWSEKDDHVYMTGPAADVFDGDIQF